MTGSKDLPAPEVHASIGLAVSRTKLLAKDRQVLVESVTRDLESIEDAWLRLDETGMLERIHSLKGALFVVGEHETANACSIAEEGVHAQGLNKCHRDIEHLKRSLRHLLDLYAAS